MRPNPMRAAVERGEVQIGSWINIVHNPAVLTLMKAAGLDFARVDMEHSMPSAETINSFALLARALDFPLSVRPPSPSKEWIQRLLDAGIWNLHITGIETVEQAAEVAAATRYWPMGTRGAANQAAGSDFDMSMPPSERMAFMNREVFLTVMLETPEALSRADEIAAIDGIDALTIGPSDLAKNMGIQGSPDQARIIDEKRMEMIAAAKRHGKHVALLVGNDEQAKRWIAEGVLILAYRTDTSLLYEAYNRIAKVKS